MTKKARARPMLNQWRPIPNFSNYSVSSEGFVRNDESGRTMAMSVNQSGIVYVRLTKQCVQHGRAVAPLVAAAFVRDRMHDSFDCPINIDGDRFNNRAANLVWRPRWFATKFFRQIDEAHFEDHYPIKELNTLEYFDSPWDAVYKYGLLQADVLLSICNGTMVWPTQQQFRRA